MIGTTLSHFKITAKLGEGGLLESRERRSLSTLVGVIASHSCRRSATILVCTVFSALTVAEPLAATRPASTAELERAAKVVGAIDLHSIRYSGSGATYRLGQSVRPGEPWPRAPGELARSTVVIDYEAGSRRWEKVQRHEGREQHGAQLVSGRFAWDSSGSREWPADFAADERWLQIWVTPHGFIRAGLASKARVEYLDAETIEVSFTLREKFRIKGWITIDQAV